MKPKNHFLFFSVILVLFLLIPAKTVTAEEPAKVSLTVKQYFKNSSSCKEADLTSTYQLRSIDSENPMPDKKKGISFSFSINGNQKETKLDFQYTHTGTYHYELFQTTPNQDNFHYDRSTYQISVFVQNGPGEKLLPQIIVKKEDGRKYAEITFENSYEGKTPEVPSSQPPSDSSGRSDSSAPYVKTGDSSNACFYLLIGTAAFLSLLLCTFFKKRNSHKHM